MKIFKQIYVYHFPNFSISTLIPTVRARSLVNTCNFFPKLNAQREIRALHPSSLQLSLFKNSVQYSNCFTTDNRTNYFCLTESLLCIWPLGLSKFCFIFFLKNMCVCILPEGEINKEKEVFHLLSIEAFPVKTSKQHNSRSICILYSL